MDLIGLLPSMGNFAFTVIAFVIALSIIVAVHEFGHYIVGRWSGIHAEVFSLGFGPVLFSRRDRRGTKWQVAALPFGGFVKFLGDANAASAGADADVVAGLDADERRRTMTGAPLWARTLTVAAGPVFNFILSIIVFAVFYLFSGIATDTPTVGTLKTLPGGVGEIQQGDRILAVGGYETPDFAAMMRAVEALPSDPVLDYRVARGDGDTVLTIEGPVLYPARAAGVTPGSAAMDAGIAPGDVIIAADGAPIVDFGDLQAAVNAAEGAPIGLSVWRAGETFEVTLAPRISDLPKPDGGFETRYLIGISGDFFFQPATRQTGLGEAVQGGVNQTWFIAKASVSGLYHMITGAISTCNLRGPIGIAETSGAAASQGFDSFVWFVAVLSTAVGLINLFPIPVLDGGHLVFYAWEAVAGRPPSDKALNLFMTAGLALVLTLMVFGLTNDIFCP